MIRNQIGQPCSSNLARIGNGVNGLIGGRFRRAHTGALRCGCNVYPGLLKSRVDIAQFVIRSSCETALTAFIVSTVAKSKGRGRPSKRDGAKPPRRAGFDVQVAFDKNALKSLETMKKYRTGYNYCWSVRRCRSYMKRIGLKEPGTYSKKNQHNGDMFALPNEFSLSSRQAGTIARHCYKAGSTLSQLENVRKMLSFAYQLTTGAKKGNFKAVNTQWESQDPAYYLDPTQKVKAEVSPEPKNMTVMFKTPFDETKGMPFPLWNVGLLLTHDSFLVGSRSVTDLERVKKSRDHTYAPSQGWMSTVMVGGRAKLERRKGTRDWSVYRVCLCPKGKHVPPPDNWQTLLDKNSNPKEVTWCSTCPLNAFKCIREMLPDGDLRTYPRWVSKQDRYSPDDHGPDAMKKLMLRWIDLQGGNPDGLTYDTNGGRKTLGKMCQTYQVMYHESFELHGDLWCTWCKYYQEKLGRDPLFKRRTQSPDPDVCCAALRKFAKGITDGVTAQPSMRAELEGIIAHCQALMGRLS